VDWSFYTDTVIPALNRGLLTSIALIVPSAVCGLALGIFVGSVRAFGRPWAKRAADWYAAIWRGTPLVCQLFIIYFGLPNIGIYLEPYTAAVVGFILCSGAYHSEYVRGGVLSIKRGQQLAARALGFSRWKTVFWIIVPQAVRRALPGCGNEIIYLIKYSSLAYVITCIELTGEGKVLASKFFRFTDVFLAVGAYYLILVSLATMILHRVEKALYIPGFGRRN